MSQKGVNLTIDGCPVVAEPGMNLIQAARLAGITIPHFCYHPELCIAGNCRMCLVETGTVDPAAPPPGPGADPAILWAPKLAAACNTPVKEGLAVRTRSPRVLKARRGIMEFLLINHPLDCPICDQAGECRLQELAMDCGVPASRFAEDKERKPKRQPLNAKIMLDDERCILCSRCIRFMRDVAGKDCLGFVERGGHSYLTCYPGLAPDTNYDLNIVDLCPVGALTSADFRFKQRLWFLKETPSVCPHCATGCNTVIASREGVVYRQTPRENPAVNRCWMCDYGRLNYKMINDPQRLTQALRRDASGRLAPLPLAEAVRLAAEALQRAAGGGAGRVAVVGSARATTEELFLTGQLADLLKASVRDVAPRCGPADRLLMNADRNPNTRGAELTGMTAAAGNRFPLLADGIRRGDIKALLAVGEDVTAYDIGVDLLAKLECLVVLDMLPTATTQAAHVVLPGASWAEKDGTFVNARGRLQRINAAVAAPGEARPDLETLGALAAALGGAPAGTAAEVFERMAASVKPLAGLTFAGIGGQGVALGLE